MAANRFGVLELFDREGVRVFTSGEVKVLTRGAEIDTLECRLILTDALREDITEGLKSDVYVDKMRVALQEYQSAGRKILDYVQYLDSKPQRTRKEEKFLAMFPTKFRGRKTSEE